jgi:hypothetical protein
MSDMGPMSPARWHSAQRRWRIDATSEEKVIAGALSLAAAAVAGVAVATLSRKNAAAAQASRVRTSLARTVDRLMIESPFVSGGVYSELAGR